MLGKKRWSIVLALLVCILMVSPVFAAGGQGDGNKGDSKTPLVLESSSIADGTRGIDLSTDRISLTFSKNVVNISVNEANAKCFSIIADGKEVPFTVEMADDQLYRELRNDVVLVFDEALKPDTAYTVKISPELESKSGEILGQEVMLNFTTAEAAAGVVSTPSTGASNNNLLYAGIILAIALIMRGLANKLD